MMQDSLFLSHKTGDCGYYTSGGNTHDVFAVSLADGKHVAYIRFEYEGDDTNFSATLVPAQEYKFNIATLPGCMGDMHLLASVQCAVIKGFGEDEDFYFEQFYDEDGNDIVKEFTLLPL